MHVLHVRMPLQSWFNKSSPWWLQMHQLGYDVTHWSLATQLATEHVPNLSYTAHRNVSVQPDTRSLSCSVAERGHISRSSDLGHIHKPCPSAQDSPLTFVCTHCTLNMDVIVLMPLEPLFRHHLS